MIMEHFKSILGTALALCLTVAAHAASPTFLSKSGTNTGLTTVVFPADPLTQIRLVNVICTSDTNLANVTVYGGTSAHSTTNGLSTTNVNAGAGSSNLFLTSVSPLTNSDWVVVETQVTNFLTKIASVSGTSNMITLTNSIGFTNTTPVNVYRMADFTRGWVVGAVSNKIFSSDALYVAPSSGRPVAIILGPSGSNSVDASIRYE
jgi:hypothetical protein